MSVVLVMTLTVVLAAGPAWADEYETGFQFCTTTFAGIQSKSIGTVWHLALDYHHPAGWTQFGKWTDCSWTVHRSTTWGLMDVSWEAYTTGALNYGKTYAYCTAFN